MTMDSSQKTELAKPVTRAVYFVELQFTTSTQYLSTMNQTITWGGHDWIGLGVLGAIGDVTESDGTESSALDFTLTAAEPSWLALSAGPVTEYRGKAAKMYFCPLDESFQLVGTPALCWRGTMSTMSIGIDNSGSGAVTLRCETSAYGLKRRPSLRLNAAQQKAKHPTDTGLDYLTDLLANPQSWLSRRFQEI